MPEITWLVTDRGQEGVLISSKVICRLCLVSIQIVTTVVFKEMAGQSGIYQVLRRQR